MKQLFSTQGVVGIFSSLVFSLTTIAGAADCDPTPAGLVGWWQGEDNALDTVGGNNGILENGTSFITGEVGNAFEFNGINNFILVNPATPSSLDVGQSSGLTIELWINPASVTPDMSMVKYERALGTYDGSNVGVQFFTGVNPNQGPLPGGFAANLMDTTGANHLVASPANALTAGTWQHVALTYDKSSGLAVLYLNGSIVQQASLGTFVPQTSFTNLLIGAETTFGSVSAPVDVFSGALDEISLYNRALSANEIQAIYQAGSAGKCTTPTAPTITLQPTYQSVAVGGTASFVVTAGGTTPLAYQWSFDGINIVAATNATLTLTNIQFGQAGNYSVLVTNPFGSTNSAVAALNVTPEPVGVPVPSGIVAWWQGESNALEVIGGNNGILENGTSFITGEVGNAFEFNGINNFILVNPATPSSLDVGQSSGLTIELWINPASVTPDMSMVKYERALGTYDGSNVGVQFFTGVNPNQGPLPGGFAANLMDTTGANHLVASPANALTAGTWQHVALTYDKSSGLAVLYLNGSIVQQASLGTFAPQTSFTNLLIGAETTFGSVSAPVDVFSGALDEISLYSRALSGNEIQAIYQAGSAGKSLAPMPPLITSQPASQTNLAGSTAAFTVTAIGTAPLAYQWSFDGTNIAGATNAALTLADVQLAQAGDYTVQVSNSGGSTNSASAILIVAIPPVITQQPQSLSAPSFGSASFGVAAIGTGPLTYQWQINGTNLVDDGNFTGSTTTNLTIASVSPSDAGNYQVVVTSPYAFTNSAVAILTVPETVISLGSTNAASGSTITVPVIINALGVESGFIGSVAYDPTKLVLQTIVGASPNYNQTNNGFIGFLAYPTVGDTFAPGSNTVAQLVFITMPVTNNTTVGLVFTNQPEEGQLTDLNFDNLPAVYEGGVVQLTPAEYYADVYPRFDGDHQLTLRDWQEEGRMVAGLDVPTNSDEFLRADCAPRGAADGVLTVADWVQAGRYALGLDPLTIVTPPVTSGVVSKVKSKDGQTGTRIVQAGTVSAQRGQTVNVSISLICLTNENALGLTVSYNTNQLQFLSASLGSGLAGVRGNINSNQVGKVGLALAVSPGVTLPAGTNQMAVLTFAARTTASGTAALTLDSSVVKEQTADLLAESLPTTYINGAVVLPAQPTLGATMANGQLQFTWPLNSGTFQVQVADQPTGPWTTLNLPQINSGANATSVLTTTNQQQYFRLLGQ